MVDGGGIGRGNEEVEMFGEGKGREKGGRELVKEEIYEV